MTEQTRTNKAQTFGDSEARREGVQPDASVEAVKDAGGDEIQARFDEAAEQGFFGESQDPTPREHYTLEGVGQGSPTPETDPELRMNQPRRSY